MRLPRIIRPGPCRDRGFTIIEIAICLGIIGFALVAIIAALPRGLDVQKRNREETIVAQDAEVWMSALRNGAKGYDDLTNYVLCITNFYTDFDSAYHVVGTPGSHYYTLTNSDVGFPLTNGSRIIGLLSTPKIVPDFIDVPPVDGFRSNYTVAYVRAFSGAVVDKVPQTNAVILSDAFTYRLIVEDFPYAPVDTNSFCVNCNAEQVATNGLSADGVNAVLMGRTNLAQSIMMLQRNARDFRLRFRWPVLPNGQIPNYGLATFRSMTSGMLLQTNDPAYGTNQPLYFVQAGTFTNNSLP